MPASPRTPRTPRTPRATGDTRAARSQLRTADPDARVTKDKRAVVSGRVVENDELTAPLLGREFRLGEAPSIMALMEWNAASGSDALLAAFHVLGELVHEDDWQEFRDYARDEHIDPEDLALFFNAAMEKLAGRPTGEPSGS